MRGQRSRRPPCVKRPRLNDLRQFKRTFHREKPPPARLNLDWIGGGKISRWGEKKWRVSVGRSATRGWHRHLADGGFGLLRSPDTRSGAPRKDKRATVRVRCGGGGGYDSPARWMLAATRAMRPDRQSGKSWAKPTLKIRLVQPNFQGLATRLTPAPSWAFVGGLSSYLRVLGRGLQTSTGGAPVATAEGGCGPELVKTVLSTEQSPCGEEIV